MRAVLRQLLVAIGVVWFVGLAVLGFLAYFVTSKGTTGPCDGLGRSLSEAPALMRMFFGQQRMWAGWGWFAGDMLVFWGSVAAAIGLSKIIYPDSNA
jgi:hypothetical protein